MKNSISISKIIKPFNKIITIDGDKSLSIRWALLASQAKGKSRAVNLLKSEDVLNTLNCLKILGIKIKSSKDHCEIIGKGINGFDYTKKLTLDAGNSGTLARLILGLLVHAKNKLKLCTSLPEPKVKSNYAKAKKKSIMMCDYLISDNQEYVDMFNSTKKKDDLSDALLQGLWFITTLKLI